MTATATVYLGLGANVGNREANLRAALRYLAEEVTLGAASSLYETEPVGLREQPPFFNAVAVGQTPLSPLELLAFAKGIEGSLGRVSTTPNGPRPIDIDLLLYEDVVLELPDLVIPHPRLHQRAFVLVPLAELAPELRHPTLGKTVAEMLAALEPLTGVKRLEEQWCQLPAVRRAR